MKPCGYISDTHNHNWHAFATANSDGVNNRLRILLDELFRCADEVRKAGGDTIINAGDTFHVRGNIAPSVLNPTVDAYRKLVQSGFKIYILPGNHDLEGKEADRVGSAVTALEEVGCRVIHDVQVGTVAHDHVVMVPWTQDIARLKETLLNLSEVSDDGRGPVDLVIHAPVDGVLPGIPNHGLSPEWLASLKFRYVFAGHYHHHKDFGNGVFSIGALAHHTWGDVGSKAGFLIVSDEGVRWFKSRAPEFVDLSIAKNETEAEMLADQNYVRARIESSKMSEINKLREWLVGAGAKGVVIQTVKEPSKTRDGSVAHSVMAGASIEASVDEFIKSQSFTRAESVQRECQRILSLAGV